MFDDSSIVLEWEIDNAAAKVATGRMESGVLEKGGFKWSASLERHPGPSGRRWDDKAKFTLRCDMIRSHSWTCEAEVSAYHSTSSKRDFDVDLCEKQRFFFDQDHCSVSHVSSLCWSGRSLSWSLDDCIEVGSISFEISINVISAERNDPVSVFDAPNNRSNVILRIGKKRLHVSKELLAIHSPVFNTLFFGDFAENGKEKIKITDVVYEEFIDLLDLIYLRTVKITDSTAIHILKLADQYQIEHIVKLAKEHLTLSTGIDAVTKLLVADQYGLIDLRDHILHSFTSAPELIAKLKMSPEFDNFSEGLKAAICERIVKF